MPATRRQQGWVPPRCSQRLQAVRARGRFPALSRCHGLIWHGGGLHTLRQSRQPVDVARQCLPTRPMRPITVSSAFGCGAEAMLGEAARAIDVGVGVAAPWTAAFLATELQQWVAKVSSGLGKPPVARNFVWPETAVHRPVSARQVNVG